MNDVKPGDILEHKLNKEWVMVLEVKGEKIICRTKNLTTIEFESFELKQKKQ